MPPAVTISIRPAARSTSRHSVSRPSVAEEAPPDVSTRLTPRSSRRTSCRLPYGNRRSLQLADAPSRSPGCRWRNTARRVHVEACSHRVRGRCRAPRDPHPTRRHRAHLATTRRRLRTPRRSIAIDVLDAANGIRLAHRGRSWAKEEWRCLRNSCWFAAARPGLAIDMRRSHSDNGCSSLGAQVWRRPSRKPRPAETSRRQRKPRGATERSRSCRKRPARRSANKAPRWRSANGGRNELGAPLRGETQPLVHEHEAQREGQHLVHHHLVASVCPRLR